MRKPVECQDPHVEFWIDTSDSAIPIADVKTNGAPEANARLIASAPDLLYALETLFDLHCISYYDYETEKVEAATQARAAIAKAHGTEE